MRQFALLVPFFEPPPPPPEPTPPEEWQTPEWMGPPEDVLGSVVALGLLVARSAKAVVIVPCATAYPTGVEFSIDVRWRGRGPDAAWHPWAWQHDRERGDELPDELFRAGVEFADGSKATTLDAGPAGPFPRAGVTFAAVAAADDEEPDLPEAPVLMPRGGGGGSQRWSQSFWLWPLPPEGPLSFVCEWPALDIPLSRSAIETTAIRAAAERSRPLWA
jgi:hypothetical protein